MAQDRVIVGTFAGAFGVQGEVRLKSFCADPVAIADYTPLITEDGRSIGTIVITGQTKGSLTARVEGITTKEQADAMRGTTLTAPRDQLPNLPDDEFYHADLIGLAVLDTSGREIGTVKAILNNGADDLLEVHGGTLTASVLVPFTKRVAPTVDLATGRIIIDPPEGLLPDAAPETTPDTGTDD